MRHPDHSYGNFTAGFVRDLAGMLAGNSVLEVFAGNGRLAQLLSAEGVKIRATSVGSMPLPSNFPIEEIECIQAVRKYGDESDVLLMSWPTTTEATTVAALEWGSDRPIIFIGEITKPEAGGMGLGGCATDFYFAVTEIERDIASYEPSNMLERAVVMKTRPECVERWRAGSRSRDEIEPPDSPFRPSVGWGV